MPLFSDSVDKKRQSRNTSSRRFELNNSDWMAKMRTDRDLLAIHTYLSAIPCNPAHTSQARRFWTMFVARQWL